MFFLNPPFNNQTGHSDGKAKDPNVVGEEFIHMKDTAEIGLRDIRSAFAKFMYKIEKISEEYDYEDDVIVGLFSKSTWINGEDSESFYKFWMRRYEFVSGFLVPSKVFRGTKGNWPVMFSIWRRKKEVNYELTQSHLRFDVFDESLQKVGVKDYIPYPQNVKKLKEYIDKECLKKLKKVPTVPLKNDHQVYDKGEPYIDYMHEGGLGYLRTISNDVQNSSAKLMLLSRPYGGDNHNGLTIVPSNFENCLFVYGVRKSIKCNWLNDKDEFLIPEHIVNSNAFTTFKKKAALYSILDGGYTSALGEVKYKRVKERVFNEFFALDLKFLKKQRNISIGDIPEKDPFAASWIKSNKQYFNLTCQKALDAYEDFIVASFESGNRSLASKERFLNMPDASPRQLLNGLYALNEHKLSKKESEALKNYKEALQELRIEVEKDVYNLGVLANSKVFEDEEIQDILDTPIIAAPAASPAANVEKTKAKTKKLLTKSEFDEIIQKRVSLASYLVEAFKDDPNFKRTKFAKLLYTIDMEIDEDLGTTYKRDAAGPLDKDLIYSSKVGIEELGRKYQAFMTSDSSRGVQYKPLPNLKAQYRNAKEIFKKEIKKVDHVVEVFKPFNTEQSEIVATIYACWNDFLANGVKPSDEQIVQEFREQWHDKKKRFSPKRILDAISWMKKKKLVPKGTKTRTSKKEKASKKEEIPF